MPNYPGQAYTPIAGNGSMGVNSQLVNVPMIGQFFPSLALAPYYKGNGQPPPTIPLNYTSATGGDMSANVAAANPWSITQSPLPIIIIALVGGLIWLRVVHWG